MDYFYQHRSDQVLAMKTLDFTAHLHEQIELGYLEEGTSELYIEDCKYTLEQGDFFIIFPNQIHRYEKSKSVRAKLIIFSPEHIPEFNGVFSKKIPESPVIRKNIENAVRIIELCLAEYDAAAPEILRGLMLALCGMLFKNMELKTVDKFNTNTLKSILLYCNEHFTDSINIDDAARELHISRSHISHVLKDKLNISFGQYLASKRLDYACQLLENDTVSITEAAYASGFSSVRTFNRIFATQKGHSPREHRFMRKGRA